MFEFIDSEIKKLQNEFKLAKTCEEKTEIVGKILQAKRTKEFIEKKISEKG